ncbi:major capsid protein [Enterobacter hormaechei]|uniref:major capsid protein n=1 Tax=Enterobacter hormaechei TaxID=158836 RepID=UPI0014955C53|nr:major capsid protein [Enterobacter hormaechei]MBF9773883.1 major capsid protein [Enterobacter hormaechei]HCM9306946.1 major capsid protein [Enterobacter hormaechei subsp. steigerwaltii]HCM9601432.1 major capsid protein [Enterobacter hormaechei subsp. steigerwaltii]
MSVKDIRKEFEGLDLVGTLKDSKEGNYLIQDLGLFSRGTSSVPNARVADIAAAEESKLESVSRYGTDTNHMKAASAVFRDAEIPVFHETGMVRPHDWQPLIDPETNQQMAITNVISERATQFERDYRRTVETSLAEALFERKVTAPHTDDGDISFDAAFGVRPGSFTLDASADSLYQQLAKLRRQVAQALGGARNYSDRLYVLCDSGLYDAIATNKEIQAFILHSVQQAQISGVVIPNALSGFNTMSLGPVTFVDLAGDPTYKVEENSGLVVPRMTNPEVSFLRRIAGPCSRNQSLAVKGGVKDRYGWTSVDDDGMIKMQSEFSLLPLLLRPQWLTTITLK